MNFGNRGYNDPDGKLEQAKEAMQKIKTKGKRFVYLGIVLVLLLMLGLDSWFIIDQTERGNIRRFGTRVYDVPLKPGLHFKIPLFDSEDTITVTLTTLHIPPFKVMTIDNQEVTITENFNYTIEDSSVNYLLYEVGKSGKGGIEDQIVPVALERTRRVFNVQNMSNINANSEKVTAAVTDSVVTAVEELFRLKTHSFQLAKIDPSPAFMSSNEAAVRAKNAAIEQENIKQVKQFQADQDVITAKGKADAAIHEARGKAQSVLLEAEANYTKLVKEGEGQEKRLLAEIKPFGNPDKYVAYLDALARLKWNGQQPQIMAGGGSSMNMILPLPNMTSGADTKK